MSTYPDDIYAEPQGLTGETLANLGPLAPLAGVWEGTRGVDIAPKRAGARTQEFHEKITLQPVDPGNNGPQLLYALRYHTRMTKPGEIGTYHDQVGYWLWEPATGRILYSLTIPRGQIVLAEGQTTAAADSFELVATQGLDTWGICSAPFLHEAFRTTEFRIRVSFNADGSWGYEEDTVLQILGQAEPFHHVDKNLLHKVAEPTPNPLVRGRAR